MVRHPTRSSQTIRLVQPSSPRCCEKCKVRTKPTPSSTDSPSQRRAYPLSLSTSDLGRLSSLPTAIPSSVPRWQSLKLVYKNSAKTIHSTSVISRQQRASHPASTASMTAHTSDFPSKICGFGKKCLPLHPQNCNKVGSVAQLDRATAF